jgi:hypothetical protein
MGAEEGSEGEEEEGMKYRIEWYCAGYDKPLHAAIEADSGDQAIGKLGEALTRLVDPGSVAKAFKKSTESKPEWVINFGDHRYFIDGRSGAAPFAEAHRFKTSDAACAVVTTLPDGLRKVAAVIKVPPVCHAGAACAKEGPPLTEWAITVEDRGYFVGFIDNGPSFGGNIDTAARFTSEAGARDSLARMPGSITAIVESVPSVAARFDGKDALEAKITGLEAELARSHEDHANTRTRMLCEKDAAVLKEKNYWATIFEDIINKQMRGLPGK